MAQSTPARKYPWPWTRDFTLEIFDAAVPELLTLANATPEDLKGMPAALAKWAPNVKRIALSLCGSQHPQMNFPSVPLPVAFAVKNRSVSWTRTFPLVGELVEQEAQRQVEERQMFSLDRKEAMMLSVTPESIAEGSLRLFSAFTLLLALSADDRLRFRIKRCGLDACGRFFKRGAARSGADRKGGKRDFCPGTDHAARWKRSPAGRKDAAFRAKLSRSGVTRSRASDSR